MQQQDVTAMQAMVGAGCTRAAEFLVAYAVDQLPPIERVQVEFDRLSQNPMIHAQVESPQDEGDNALTRIAAWADYVPEGTLAVCRRVAEKPLTAVNLYVDYGGALLRMWMHSYSDEELGPLWEALGDVPDVGEMRTVTRDELAAARDVEETASESRSAEVPA